MPTKYVWWKEQQGISKPVNLSEIKPDSLWVVLLLFIKWLLSSASCFVLGGSALALKPKKPNVY